MKKGLFNPRLYFFEMNVASMQKVKWSKKLTTKEKLFE